MRHLSTAFQGFQGTALWYRMYNSFGYLNNKGYGGHLFPIFVGEIGSKFESQTDIQSLNDMQAWFLAKPNTGADHNAVSRLACKLCRSRPVYGMPEQEYLQEISPALILLCILAPQFICKLNFILVSL